MKKFMMLVLTGLMALSFMACSRKDTQQSSEDEEHNFSISSYIEESAESMDGENITKTTEYEIGDIILSNGSVVKTEDITAIDDDNFPIAVIAGFQENGTAFGVGVHRSDVPLQWTTDDSAGYAINFTDTVCTQKSDFEFSGDKDGTDNWEAICVQDSEDTVDAAVNYPAFHFVNTYAETYNLSSNMVSGWYMPSIVELCNIYQNREAINTSLQKIYGLDKQAAMNGLETNWYWSSSQASTEDDYAWFVHYFNGYAGECPKNFTNVHALAIRKF